MLYRLQGWRDPERLAALAFWLALLVLLGVIETSGFRVPALAVRSWSIVRELCAAALLLPLVLAGFRRVPPVSGASALAHGAASIAFGLLVYAAAGGVAGPLNVDRLNGAVALYWILLAARWCHLSLRGPELQRAEQLSLDLVRAPSAASSHRERFVVRRRGREVVVPAGEINWIQAAGHDVVLHLGGASYRLRESMQSVEQSLDPSSFVRVHRSRIVNLDRVRDIRPWAWGDFRIVMQDGSVVNFSRRYRDRLEELLSG
jgi:DNA-binding LytR/AlgR family response regulator